MLSTGAPENGMLTIAMPNPFEDDPTLSALIRRFHETDCCWFSSTRVDGRVHTAPIWHVWCEERAYVVTQSGTVRAHNVAANPSVSLSLPDPMNVLIIEGEANPAPAMEMMVQPIFQAKYGWNIVTDSAYDLILSVIPHKIMAWGDHGEGRWYFDRNGNSR